MPMVFNMWRRRAGTVADTEEPTPADPAPVEPASAQTAVATAAETASVDFVSAPAAPPQAASPQAASGDTPVRAASGDGRRRAPGVAVRALLALFLVVGLAGAAIAGMQAKNAAARQSRQSFDQTASGIAARVTDRVAARRRSHHGGARRRGAEPGFEQSPAGLVVHGPDPVGPDRRQWHRAHPEADADAVLLLPASPSPLTRRARRPPARPSRSRPARPRRRTA